MFCLWVVRGRFNAIQICNAIKAIGFIVSTEKIFIYLLVLLKRPYQQIQENPVLVYL